MGLYKYFCIAINRGLLRNLYIYVGVIAVAAIIAIVALLASGLLRTGSVRVASI